MTHKEICDKLRIKRWIRGVFKMLKEDVKKIEVNTEVLFRGQDFDGSFLFKGVVSEVYEDHAIVLAEDMTLWLDKDTCNQFFVVKEK